MEIKKIFTNKDKIFTAKPLVLSENCRPYGELYGEFQLIKVKSADGNVKDKWVQSNRLYIREYYKNGRYFDTLIDSNTLEDVTDPSNPIFLGDVINMENDWATYNWEIF